MEPAPVVNVARPRAKLTEGSITLNLLRLAVPIIISNMLQTAYQLVDTFWVGRLSAEAVAAVSFCFPISFLLIALGGGLPIAGTVLLAQYTGRGDEDATNHVAAQTLLMVFLISLVLAAIGYSVATPIMRLMGAAPDVLPDAVRFFQIAVLGFIFVFAFFAYQALMRGAGVVYPPMLIVFITVVINFALDPLLIFGWGPLPRMGVAGSAMATLLTQTLAAGIGLTLMVRGRHGIHLKWHNLRARPGLDEEDLPHRVSVLGRAIDAGPGNDGDDDAGVGIRHDSGRGLWDRRAGDELRAGSGDRIVGGNHGPGRTEYRRRPVGPRRAHQPDQLLPSPLSV